MHYTVIFKVVKIETKFSRFFFSYCCQSIDCEYTLEPPRLGGSNEYPRYMFWSLNKKIRYTPANHSFFIASALQCIILQL